MKVFIYFNYFIKICFNLMLIIKQTIIISIINDFELNHSHLCNYDDKQLR